MSKLQNQKIVAIVVAFFPDDKTLNKSIESLSMQCDSIIVVDNTPSPLNSINAKLINNPKINLISLGNNFGIAYAQNIGLQAAIDAKADFVLLMDQDSVPQGGMVTTLRSIFDRPKSNNLIASGPTYIDPRTSIRSYFIVSRFGLPFRYKPDNKSTDTVLEVAFIISSGTLISVPKLIQVGGMRSNYFIDHVDTEWCLRAKAKGYSIVGVVAAKMEHSLGDKVKRVWLFYMRSVAYHAPLRDYYVFRNTILMLRDVKMPLLWRLSILWRLIPFSIYFTLFSQERIARISMMYLGLQHGLLGIDGELNLSTRSCSSIPKTKLDPA